MKMRRRLTWLLLIALLALASACRKSKERIVTEESGGRPEVSSPEAAASEPAATVVLQVFRHREMLGTGSGFFIDPYILVTAYHVITGAHDVTVESESGDPCAAVATLAFDAAQDWAVLQTTCEGLTPFVIGNPEALRQGERLFLVASPQAVLDAQTRGRFLEAGEGRAGSSIVFHTAPSAGGSSGGALVNAQRQVVGIHLGTLDGRRYAVSIQALPALNDLRQRTPRALSGL